MRPITNRFYPVENATALMALAREKLSQDDIDRIVSEEYQINPLGRAKNEYAGTFFMYASVILLVLVFISFLLIGFDLAIAARFFVFTGVIFTVGFSFARVGKVETTVEQFASAHLRAQVERWPVDRIVLLKASKELACCQSTGYVLDDVIKRRGERIPSSADVAAGVA